MKRIRLVSSPSKKSRIDLLRKARIACYKCKVGLLKGKKKLEAELGKCKMKLKQMSDETVDCISHEANLTEAQQLVLRECVAAGKTGSKEGRQYSDNWIILCLLLHIRSPTGYRFLMENEVLELPSV